jgi:hypothetical protein
MKGLKKLMIAGLTVAVFIATTTCIVIYTAGCGSSGGSDDQSLTPTPTPIISPTPHVGPSPTPSYR